MHRGLPAVRADPPFDLQAPRGQQEPHNKTWRGQQPATIQEHTALCCATPQVARPHLALLGISSCLFATSPTRRMGRPLQVKAITFSAMSIREEAFKDGAAAEVFVIVDI